MEHAEDILRRMMLDAPEVSTPIKKPDWVIDGNIVRSTRNPRSTAMICVIDGVFNLDFGHEAQSPSYWPTTKTHIRKYYYPIG
jgi:hypothetical protein